MFCVFRHKRTGKWTVQIRIKRKPVHCGTFHERVNAMIHRNAVLQETFGSLVNYWRSLGRRPRVAKLRPQDQFYTGPGVYQAEASLGEDTPPEIHAESEPSQNTIEPSALDRIFKAGDKQ